MERDRKGRKDGESERGVVYRQCRERRGEKSFTREAQRSEDSHTPTNHQKPPPHHFIRAQRIRKTS